MTSFGIYLMITQRIDARNVITSEFRYARYLIFSFFENTISKIAAILAMRAPK